VCSSKVSILTSFRDNLFHLEFERYLFMELYVLDSLDTGFVNQHVMSCSILLLDWAYN